MYPAAGRRDPAARRVARRSCDALDAEALRRRGGGGVAGGGRARADSLPPHRFEPRRADPSTRPPTAYGATARANLVAAARAAGARRLICQSIAFAYAPAAAPRDHGRDRAVQPPAPPPFADAVRVDRGDGAGRARRRRPRGAGAALRLVLRARDLLRRGRRTAERGPLAALSGGGSGAGLFSFVHLDDAAAATVAAVERGAPGIYNVVDDEPAAMRDWLPVYAAAIGAPPPRRVPVWLARLVAARRARA